MERNIYKIGKELFITNDEEIKDGTWVIKKDTNKVVFLAFGRQESYNKNKDLKEEFSKIILTTDQDLIKDGVQAIDDDFLEWFVKNPSCEEVKTEKWLDDEGGVFYSRIIPKEEPKQETLEEAAINCWAEGAWDNRDDFTDGFVEGAKSDTARDYWFKIFQQEQDKNKYSEEEVHKIIGSYEAHKLSFGIKFTYNKWFEQFKKK
jgi:hypothetical protein